MRIILCYFYTSILILFPLSIYSLVTLQGNGNNEKTFNFSVGSSVVDPFAELIYCGADITEHKQNKANAFAISRINQLTGQVEPLTPATATINITGTQQPNPLYDAGIRALSVMHITNESLPVVLTQADNNLVYMFEQTNSTEGSLLRSQPINDAQIEPTRPAQTLSLLATDHNGHIFTCTTPQAGVFGDPGSGIAVIVRGFKTENDTQLRVFQQLNALTGDTVSPVAFPFDQNSSFLTVNDIPLSTVTPTVLWWDHNLQCLYIAIQGTSGQEANGGIRTVAVAHMEGHKMILSELLPASALDAQHSYLLIGAQGSNQSITIERLLTMHTSTNRAYLITQGTNNVGTPVIQAVPLVQTEDRSLQGTLAASSSPVEELFTGYHTTYQKTVVPQPATTPNDLPLLDDPALNVGGSGILPGQISSISNIGDTVYVTITDSPLAELDGLYQTTAVIEHTMKKIVGWTSWKPVVQVGQKNKIAAVHRRTGTISFLVQDEQAIAHTFLQTRWMNARSTNSTLAPLSQFLFDMRTTTEKMLQKTVFFPSQTPSIENASMALFLHEGSITLSLLTQKENTVERQLSAEELAQIRLFHNDTVDTLPAASTITITGPLTQVVGIPLCATIAHNSSTDDGWLVVGGTQGILVYATDQGKGWSFTNGIGAQFSTIPLGFTAQKLTPLAHIQKMAASDGFLYILTDTTLYRTSLSPTHISAGPLMLTPVLSITDIIPSTTSATFTTMLMSEPLALVGTTHGLYTHAQGTNIRTLSSDHRWHQIPLPESASAVRQFFWTHPEAYEGTCTQNGALVYVYTNDMSQKYGRLHRIYIAPASEQVSNTTVSIFDDRRIASAPSHFLDCGTSYDQIATDGALFMLAHNNIRTVPSHIAITAPDTVNGHNPFLGLTQWRVPLTEMLAKQQITGMIAISGHGGWMISDNEQLYINQ